MDNAEARERWDGRYTAKGHLWGAEPNIFVAEICGAFEPGTALDLGCGQGRNAIWLASLGHTVTGLDLSPVAIAQARDIAAERGVHVEFEAVDLMSWDPAGRTWDLVVLAYLQLPPDARRRVHAAAMKALAPDGRLVIVAHHLANLERGVGGPQAPDRLFTERQLAEDFAGLAVERNEEALRHTDQGDAVDLVFVARNGEAG
jgi:2-polyprenyl-3-methyl-5-hydroxy-6-metoxy-1,4-benzoquinol methylase